MGRGKEVLVSCSLSSSLKFLLIMIPLIVVHGLAPTWRSTSHHPWMWNSATTTTITVKIPEISVDFVLDHSSPPPAALAPTATNRPGEVLGFSEAVYVSTQGTFILGFFNLLYSSYSYLGMWNARDLNQREVWDWVAIRQKRVSVATGNFTMKGDSKLMTSYIGGNSFVFDSNEAAPSPNSTAIIHYSDNLAMIKEFSQDWSDEGVLWQNLDHSTKILIPGTKLGRNLETGRNLSLFRWKLGLEVLSVQVEYHRGNKSRSIWPEQKRRSLRIGAPIEPSRQHDIVINTGRYNWRLWITISGLVILMLFAVFFFFRRKLKGKKEKEPMLHELTTSNRFNDLEENGNDGKHGHKLKVFNFDSIMIATNNFSLENIIGKGGFGHVYKGRLIDGQEIAVKRLSRGSGQGLVEFKNEIRLITKLQHMNIVRLLGCSINGEERILIYEFMPNKSLDFFLFDATCKKLLDWKKRYNIIEGIAQGLLYLHKYSRLRIIHRDLKASNILLDHDMNPRISDFGMARIVRRNEIEENTKRIAGTIGYMSPEYVMKGIFSVKSDVYSFGVLMLEIISGRKNKIFHHNDCTTNLVGYRLRTSGLQ